MLDFPQVYKGKHTFYKKSLCVCFAICDIYLLCISICIRESRMVCICMYSCFRHDICIYMLCYALFCFMLCLLLMLMYVDGISIFYCFSCSFLLLRKTGASVYRSGTQ